MVNIITGRLKKEILLMMIGEICRKLLLIKKHRDQPGLLKENIRGSVVRKGNHIYLFWIANIGHSFTGLLLVLMNYLICWILSWKSFFSLRTNSVRRMNADIIMKLPL